MKSAKLKELRKSNGLTLDELAELVGTSKQTIHRYENGIITNIPPEKVESLAYALGFTMIVLPAAIASEIGSIVRRKG